MTSSSNCGKELALEIKRHPVDHYTTDELQEALRAIASLISKSEKAQQKLTPGTWQHTMLRDNLKALHLASALMNDETNHSNSPSPDELQDGLRALASMITMTKKSQGKFSP